MIIKIIKNKCFNINSFYFTQFRYSSGISSWDENINTNIKHKIEKFWADKIKTTDNFEYDSPKDKFYVLSMFPYPSGKLHMGHVRVYTISDTVARFQRMNGKNVFHPIGWDAFGLPAENAAIEHKISPQIWTEQNINQMRQQLKRLGCSFNWSSELATCDPNYYKWTQYIFLKMFENGLAYQKEALVNWDPVDKTVLAHEQVDEKGRSWRSGAMIEKKLLKQWFIQTTKFAKDLYDCLSDPQLQDWRDIIKLQKHWIGECNGVNFDFKITGNNMNDKITIWTSKPEFITRTKFIAIKPSNILANGNYDMINNVKKLKINAENPLTGEKIPIFVSNDIIEYEEHGDFHIGIPDVFESDKAFAILVNINTSDEINELSDTEIKELRDNVITKVQKLNVGGYWTSVKLQDWLISRQRYWGTPIPIIHCKSCGAQPVPIEQLPVILPKTIGEKNEWLNTTCPKCNGNAKRESDTMDTFVDSAWYFLRYIDPKNNNSIFDKKLAAKLMPVDLYIGGKEHAVLHLYYARFLSHFLHSLGMIEQKEPFKRLLVQGMIMGESYRIKKTGKYVPKSEVTVIDAKKKKAIHNDTKEDVVIAWEKMSKSKLNGVDPDEMFENYGIDTTRLLVLADVAPTSQRNWTPATFPGILNWQHRLWLTISNFIKQRTNIPKECPKNVFEDEEYKLFDSRNFYIKGTTFNYYTSQQLSVAVSKLQGLTNSLRRSSPYVVAKSLQFERALAVQIIMLAPMAPHFASELWSGFQSAPNRLSNNEEYNFDKNVLEQTWPNIDMDYCLDLVCQTNGYENAVVKIPRRELETMDYNTAVKLALDQKEVQNQLLKRDILEIKFNIYSGYQGVVNIIATDKHKVKNVINN